MEMGGQFHALAAVPSGKEALVPTRSRLGRPRSWSRNCGEKIKHLTLQGSQWIQSSCRYVLVDNCQEMLIGSGWLIPPGSVSMYVVWCIARLWEQVAERNGSSCWSATWRRWTDPLSRKYFSLASCARIRNGSSLRKCRHSVQTCSCS
jgi:hypothetical protein